MTHGTTLVKADLPAILRRQLEALRQELPGARREQPPAVHRARVASRRLREVLPIATRVAKSGRGLKLGKMVGRLTSALGPVREIDVALQEFDTETSKAKWKPLAVRQVRRHLVGERDHRTRDMHLKLGRVDLDQLRDRVETLARACETVEPRAWHPALTARLRKRGKRLSETVRGAGTLYAADPIHRVRIAAKRLRYTLELAQAAGAPVARDISTLKRLQDLLGRLRDLQVLEDHVRVVMTETAENVKLHAALDELQTDLEAECRALHAQFLKKTDNWLALADRAARSIPAAMAGRLNRTMVRIRPGSGRASSRAASA